MPRRALASGSGMGSNSSRPESGRSSPKPPATAAGELGDAEEYEGFLGRPRAKVHRRAPTVLSACELSFVLAGCAVCAATALLYTYSRHSVHHVCEQT